MEWYKQFYTYLIYLSYILEILLYFGIIQFGPTYMEHLMTIIKLYISGYLMYKLNPFSSKKVVFDEFERNLVFSCTIYLFLSTSLAGSLNLPSV